MVKILSRDSINRMVGRKSSVAGVGGGGGDVDLSGYATKIWTQETFVSIDFFRSLFRAYDSQNHEILPNDTTSTIDNIKAMFGFWTDFYISALGTGGHQSVDLRLAQLADVNVAGVTNGQVLTYDTTSGKWIASTPQSGTDMATVWANLAAADATKQIDYSHLSIGDLRTEILSLFAELAELCIDETHLAARKAQILHDLQTVEAELVIRDV